MVSVLIGKSMLLFCLYSVTEKKKKIRKNVAKITGFIFLLSNLILDFYINYIFFITWC